MNSNNDSILQSAQQQWNNEVTKAYDMALQSVMDKQSVIVNTIIHSYNNCYLYPNSINVKTQYNTELNLSGRYSFRNNANDEGQGITTVNISRDAFNMFVTDVLSKVTNTVSDKLIPGIKLKCYIKGNYFDKLIDTNKYITYFNLCIKIPFYEVYRVGKLLSST